MPLVVSVRARLLPVALICFGTFGSAALSRPVLGATPLGATPGGASADLIVSKTGDESVPRGRNITYNVVVGNDGPDTAAGVVVTDAIPTHTTFVNATVSQGTFNFASNTVTANFGSINFTESATLTVTVSIDNDTPRDTLISNTATVTSDTPDPIPDNNSSTAFTVVTGPFAGDLVISEFRVRGPGGGGQGRKGLSNTAADEFIEIYNNTESSHLVTSASGTGYAIVASDGVLRCTIPDNTIIPAKGHFLCVNSNGYSLSAYPAGNGSTATGDASYTTDIPDNAGIALFNNNSGEDYTLAARLDAVGSTAEANTLYKEGTGYPALTPFNIDYSFYRDNCGRQGAVSSLQPCTITTGVVDTNNNANDFIFVDTNGTSAGAGQRLGAPGPENLSSPIENNAQYNVTFLDPCVAGSAVPNQIRDLNSVPAQNSTFGTIELRRTITNNSISPATRLRFRVTQQTTFPAPSGTADLRIRTSADTSGTVNLQPCGSGSTEVMVNGTTIEQPPTQPNGGAFNSTVSVPPVGPGILQITEGIIQLPSGPQGVPLNPGSSINLRFLWGVQQTGKFRVTLNVEVLDTGGEPEKKPEEIGKTATTASQAMKGKSAKQ
jgi:uncharacterized repeat protein (TIGR01451 family)